MARRRNRSVDAAYIPVASNAGDLAAMAQANAAFGEAMSGIGGDIKTGVKNWSDYETDRAVQYLDTLGTDAERNAALTQMQQDPIGAFLDVGAATKAVDAMQLRDMKVEERAEQALKAKDAHLDAARALAHQNLMDPKLLTEKDETIDSLGATTAKTRKETGGIDSTIAHREAQASKLNIETKKAQQEFDIEEKSLRDTKDIGLQLDELSKMPLIAEGPNPEFGTKTIQKEQERLDLNYLSAVTRQIQANKRAGKFDKHSRLMEITRKSLARYTPGITDEQFITAGVNENFTPDSHEALRRILIDSLATRYPTNTEAELRAQANKIIDTHPGNLRTKFNWGAEKAKQKYPERLAMHQKKVMDKQINEIESAHSLRDKLKLIAKHRGTNIRDTMSPEEMGRFNKYTTPFIEEFVEGIDAKNIFLNSLPKAVSDRKDFQAKLVKDVTEGNLSSAIGKMDPRLFTPSLQRKMYSNIRKNIVKQMGPMLKAELQPLVEMVMGESPAIRTQFSEAKKTVDFKNEMNQLRRDQQKDLLKLDFKAVQKFKDNSTLVESIIDNIEAQAKSDEIRNEINPTQLKFSVEKAASTIKRTLNVHKWKNQSDKDALNIAIGAFLSGVRINEHLVRPNDYTLPQIAYGRDISKLSPNQLIEGLKDHLEFAANKVQDAQEFDKIVGKYVEENPYKPSFIQKLLEDYSPVGQLMPGLYQGQDIEVFPFSSNSGYKKPSSQ